MERFRSIQGFKGYQVSDRGRVRSLRRNKDMMIKSSPDNYGYLKVILYKLKKKYSKSIHQLVAIAFLDHKPDGNKIVVDHKDHDPSNNHLDNLQLITNRENCSKDKFRKKQSSRFIGVYWNKPSNRWKSQILINGKRKYLGSYKNETDAATAYQKALKEIR